MKKKLIDEIDSLYEIFEIDQLIKAFNLILKKEVEFYETIIYHYDQFSFNVFAYKYLNNSIYKKSLGLNISNTLFEESFVNKKIIVNNDLNKIDFFKYEEYIKQASVEQLSFPLTVAGKCIGTFEIKLKTVQEYDLKLIEILIERFIIKLVDLLHYESSLRMNKHLSKIMIYENLIYFSLINDFLEINKDYDFLIKKIKELLQKGTLETKFLYNEKYFYLKAYYDRHDYFGFIKDISQTELKNFEEKREIYYDFNQKIFNHSHLKKILNEKTKTKDAFTIFKFKFSDSFNNEVFSALKSEFLDLYYHKDGIVTFSKLVDKRSIIPVLKRLDASFSKILGLDINYGIIRVNVDLFDDMKILEVLEITAQSKNIFYSKKNLKDYIDIVNTNNENKRLVNQRNFKIFVQLIINYHKEVVAYLISNEFNNYSFKDIRFHLIIIDEIIKRLAEKIKADGKTFYLEIDSKIINNYDILDFIDKRVEKLKIIKENIGFKIRNFNDSDQILTFSNKALRKGYKIASDDVVSMLFTKEFNISTMFIKLNYNQFSKIYIDLLKEVAEKKYIDFVFELEGKQDFINYQIHDLGYGLTAKKFDLNSVNKERI